MEEIIAVSSVEIENNIISVQDAIVIVSIFLFVWDLTNQQGVYVGFQYFYGVSTDLLYYGERNILFNFISSNVISQMICQSVDELKIVIFRSLGVVNQN